MREGLVIMLNAYLMKTVWILELQMFTSMHNTVLRVAVLFHVKVKLVI